MCMWNATTQNQGMRIKKDISATKFRHSQAAIISPRISSLPHTPLSNWGYVLLCKSELSVFSRWIVMVATFPECERVTERSVNVGVAMGGRGQWIEIGIGKREAGGWRIS